MAIFRKIETTFWSEDAFVLDLEKEKKFFYIYLLTNPNVNQSGCYEISKRTMSFQTGFTIQELDELIKFFTEAGKIEYDSKTSEILVKNWLKYNGSDSPKVIKNIVENVEKIKNSDFRKYCMNTLSILYPNTTKLELNSKNTLSDFSNLEKYSMDTETQEEKEKEKKKEEEKKEEKEREEENVAHELLQNFSFDDLINLCEKKSPVIYQRHVKEPNSDYRLRQIFEEVSINTSLENIEKLLEHANKTYIVQPKYNTLDLCWILNNQKAVLSTNELKTNSSNSFATSKQRDYDSED